MFNIDGFNRARSEKAGTSTKIDQELKLLAAVPIRFETPERLAAYLSVRVGVHRTTLTRNVDYYAKLFEFFLKQPGAAGYVDARQANEAVLRTRVATQELELRRLRRELKRQRTPPMVKGLESDLAQQLVQTFMLLCEVMTRAQTFKVDLTLNTVVDKSAKPSDRLVASQDRSRAFCAWLRGQRQLPYFGQLTDT